MDIFARKHLLAWTVGLLVVINLVTLGALWIGGGRKPGAAPPPRGDARPMEARRDDVRRFLERELDLSPEQSARFEDLRRRHAAGILAIQDDIHALKKAEMESLIAPNPDLAKAEELAAKIGAKEAEKEKLLFAHLREIAALCRPEQLDRFRSIIGELLRMMGPPGQSQLEDRAPDQKPPKRPGYKPPGRSADQPPKDRR